MRVLTPVVPAKVEVMAARIDSRLDGIANGGADCQSVDDTKPRSVNDKPVLGQKRPPSLSFRGEA